jgi:ketosteroid isomerase-like protein
MPARKYADYKNADPYFNIVRRALGNSVDGAHFFDIVTDDTVYEVLYDLGWPRVIQGRTDLMNAFREYVDIIKLHSADNLVVHTTDAGHVIVIEYEVHGTVLATGGKYDNRFCSIIQIENRSISHWRDYMDSHAAWTALSRK